MDRCDIQFTKPDNDGGSRITGYLIEARDIKVGEWVKKVVITKTRCTIFDLKENSEMEFRAIASNKFGLGEPSYASNSVIIRDPKLP